MSLKRKASFPSIASPQSPQRFFNPMDDSPKHLNSRTRKRVRNDRPDEQAVYAQQRVHQIPTPPAEPEYSSDQEHDEDAAMAPEPTSDHRQKSLLQFFRPAQSQPSRQLAQSAPVNQFENIQGGNDFSHGQGVGVGIVHPATPSGSVTVDMTMAMTPVPGLADRNMDMNMDGDRDGDMDMDMGL